MLDLPLILEKANTRSKIRSNVDGAVKKVAGEASLPSRRWLTNEHIPEVALAIQALLGGDVVMTQVSFLGSGSLDHIVNVLPSAPFDPYDLLSMTEMRERTDGVATKSLIELVPDLDLAQAHDIGTYLLAQLVFG